MNTQPRPSRSGFSLVEMIGVLAIIAILAVIIVPRVFSTIEGGKITAAVKSADSIKTSITEFAAKNGTIPTTNNNSRIDDLLMAAGMTEGRFTVKIGTQPNASAPSAATWSNTTGTWSYTGGSSQTGQSRVVCQTSNTTLPSSAGGRNFRLDGTNDLPSGSRVVAAVIVGITPTQALELSKTLDGPTLSQTATGTADDAGKVVYNAAGTTAYIYLVHQ